MMCGGRPQYLSIFLPMPPTRASISFACKWFAGLTGLAKRSVATNSSNSVEQFTDYPMIPPSTLHSMRAVALALSC